MTRVTIIWFVGAAVVGAAAGVLHVLRSDLGGAHTGTPLAVGAWGLTVVAGLMIYHGIVVAAGEQDEAARRARRTAAGRAAWTAAAYDPYAHPTRDSQAEPVDDEAYTFRRGKELRPRDHPRR